MLNPAHFMDLIIAPTLTALGLDSPGARELLLGTASHESDLQYLKQISGPALGLYQMEPATHDDIWANYLAYREPIASKLLEYVGAEAASGIYRQPDANEMVWNLRYATAMARIHYLRVPEPLPLATNVQAMARYWKAHYNTVLGAGTESQFVSAYERAKRKQR